MINYPAAIQKLGPTPIFDFGWTWLLDRHQGYRNRRQSLPSPWFTLEILNTHKFCNIDRILDTMSQVTARIANSGPSLQNFEEQFFRTVLAKTFNKPSTWDNWQISLGEEPALDNFHVRKYLDVLPPRAYAGAYRVHSPDFFDWQEVGLNGGKDNVKAPEFHLTVLRKMLDDGVPAKMVNCQSLYEAYTLLREYPRMGPFIASQFVQDLNYGPWLGLPCDDFAVVGPGSKRGLQKCFSNPNKVLGAKIIKLVTEFQDECCLAATGQLPPRFNGHKLYPQSCFQNFFCEVDKASRLAFPGVALGPTRVKPYIVAEGTIKPLAAPLLPHCYL